MMRPDQYYAILSIMRYGSLVLAMLFAGKIVAYAAGLHHNLARPLDGRELISMRYLLSLTRWVINQR